MRLAQIEDGIVVNVVEVKPSAIPPEMRGWRSLEEGVGIGWRVTGDDLTPPAPDAPTAQQVKAEAQRRILAILPEWRQRNLTAQAAILAEKGRANWTKAETDAWTAGRALWDRINAIRAASDALEALDPIPADYADDHHWTED